MNYFCFHQPAKDASLDLECPVESACSDDSEEPECHQKPGHVVEHTPVPELIKQFEPIEHLSHEGTLIEVLSSTNERTRTEHNRPMKSVVEGN